MTKDEDLPSPVRLKKLLPMPVVSKRLTIEDTEYAEMDSQSKGLQEQRTSWTGQCQRREQCHKGNGIHKMHRAANQLLCW